MHILFVSELVISFDYTLVFIWNQGIKWQIQSIKMRIQNTDIDWR